MQTRIRYIPHHRKADMRIDVEVIFEASTIRTIGLDLPTANMPSVLNHNAAELQNVEFHPGFVDGYDVIWRFDNNTPEARLHMIGEHTLRLIIDHIDMRVKEDPYLKWPDIIIELCHNYGDDVEHKTFDGATMVKS
jgi:hypothetical protein